MSFQTITARQRVHLSALLLVMALAYWNAIPVARNMTQHWNASTTPSWIGLPPGVGDPNARHYELDTWLIHSGLVAAPRFRDTLRWWVGTWAGQVPFYRPIPSLVFWTEWKLFGDLEIRYLSFALLIYLVATYQFVRLAGTLYRHFRCPWPALATLAAGLLCVDGLFVVTGQRVINWELFALWKNQTDSLAALFFFLALRRYVEQLPNAQPEAAPEPVQRGSLRGGRQRWSTLSAPLGRYAPLGFYLACCASKETGVFLPLLLPLLEWKELTARDRGRFAGACRRMLPLLVALPCFLVFRALCLHRIGGFTYGTNGSWPLMLRLNVLGPISADLTQRNWLPLALGLVLFGIVWTARSRSARGKRLRDVSIWKLVAWGLGIIVLLDVTAMATLRGGEMSSAGPVVALWMYADHNFLKETLPVLLFACGLVGVLGWSLQFTLLTYAWVLLALSLTLFSPPGNTHRYYPMNAGYALLLGAGLVAWFQGFRPGGQRRAAVDTASSTT